MWWRPRLAAWALLPAGTIAGHAVSYLLAGRLSHGGVHGYLPVTGWLLALAALAGLVWFAWSVDGVRSIPRLLPFTAAQLALFLVQESVEGLLEGQAVGATLEAPVIRYGIAAQLILAVTIVVAARLAAVGGSRLRAALASRRGWWRGMPGAAPPPVVTRYAETLLVSLATERGPPLLLACA